MAGIGFQLKNLLKEDRYTSDFKANLYALMLSSGPWIFAVICIAALNLIASRDMSSRDILFFRAIVVYVFAFSLVTTSLFQLTITRFISDKLFQREYGSLLPNFAGVMLLCGVVNFFVSWSYVAFLPMEFGLKVLSVVLFCTVGYQWIVMAFLGTVRDFVRITVIFLAGFVMSFVLAVLLGASLKVTGYLLGFTIGQMAVLLLLVERIVSEFPFGKNGIFEFTLYFKNYPTLVWAAFFYNLGFWVDKIIIWYSRLGFNIPSNSEPFFRGQYPYDSAAFLATLTIIPALSIFFLHVETNFYAGLRHYIQVILNKGTLIDIERQRRQMMNVLRTELSDVFKVQFLVTLIMVLIAPNFLESIGYLREVLLKTYILLLIGAFFQVMLLALVVLLWYLELLKESFVCIMVFFLANLVFNIVLVPSYAAHTVPLGTGYLAAAVIGVAVTFLVLRKRLGSLNYLTFMQKPLHEAQREMPKF
ncbi:MAG: exopolysaccharide Pel transporter PelG [Candidatus Eremiobacteraeota bacterium]|nr:exopolysaccharide Pel transporter PelG [Candidatus Eremiobacteraeota bacterium]